MSMYVLSFVYICDNASIMCRLFVDFPWVRIFTCVCMLVCKSILAGVRIEACVCVHEGVFVIVVASVY